MKLTAERPFANPEAAARKLVELVSGIEPTMPGRIYIELVNATLMRQHRGSGPEFGAGIKFAVERGWLELHESGTYVRLLKIPPTEPALPFFGPIFRYCALQFGGENLITSYQSSKEVAPYLALCFPLEALAFGNLRVERSQVRL
jgi:hypothetical protein